MTKPIEFWAKKRAEDHANDQRPTGILIERTFTRVHFYKLPDN